MALVLWMAEASDHDTDSALHAGRQALEAGGFPGVTDIAPTPAGLPPAGALNLLGRMDYRHRATLIEALEAAATSDGVIHVREMALMRACCAALECPLPRSLIEQSATP
jgi:uncharacterized membrane protein YebE (DUF533 family)